MKSIILLLWGVLFLGMALKAETLEQRMNDYNLDKGVAIKGYDPVAYFEGAPEKGSKDFEWKYEGVIYRFSSSEHLDAFKANPSKYEPQYGGWCAYVLVHGKEKVKINPKRFKIIDEKLYLFYDSFGQNTLKKWNERDEAGQIKAADTSWKKALE